MGKKNKVGSGISPVYPKWKKWLSYLRDVDLEHTSSPLNPYIGVRLRRGRLQLVSENAVYSFEDLYINFDITFQRLDWSKITTDSALILGYGLGSVVQLLEKHGIHCNSVTAVEKDPAIVSLVGRYMKDKIQSKVDFVITDAYNFVLQSHKKYDIIISDVFVDDIIPEEIRSIGYVEGLKKIINPNGVLLFNTLAFTKKDRFDSRMLFDEIFKPVFPNSLFLDAANNYIFIQDRSLLKAE